MNQKNVKQNAGRVMAYNLYDGKMVPVYKKLEPKQRKLVRERVIHELYVDRGLSQK